MAKTLTGASTTEKNKTGGVEPINILKIEYGGAIGTKYYSDRTLAAPVVAEGRVLSWGSLSLDSFEDRGQINNLSIALEDADGTLLGYLRSQEIQGVDVSLYQWFDGLTWSVDEILLLKGVLKAPKYIENPPQLQINIEDFVGRYFNKKLGTEATREIFSAIKKEHEGSILPLVFGSVERSEGIQVVDSLRTRLSIPISSQTNEAVVDDSRDFDQGSGNIYNLLIGKEYLRGYFEGRKLNITQRGMIVASGWTTAVNPNIITFRANLNPNGPHWIGYKIRFYSAPGIYVERQITNYTPSDDSYLGDIYGIDVWHVVPAWTYYEIFGAAVEHSIGEVVQEKITEYKWIINDAPSTSVDRIEIRGSLVLEGGDVANRLKNIETWITLDERYYSIDLDDSTWAGSLGHNVTSVTMEFDPESLPNTPYLGEIRPTLTGINDTAPTDVIVNLAERLGYTYPGNFDTTSETAAASSLSWLSLGFVLREKKGLEVLFEIAFQSRLSLSLEGGQFYFRYLENKAGASTATISGDEIELDGLEIEQRDTDELINRLKYSYNRRGILVDKVAEDANSQSIHGEKEKSVTLWAHQQEYTADAIAAFWLRRWANATETATITTYLTSLELERYDWATLNITDRYSSQLAEIKGVEHIPGGRGEIDKIRLIARVPKFAGCATSCELYEETGCSSTCEQVCQSGDETGCGYACETATQDACSLVCVTQCRQQCTSYYEITGDCTFSCRTSCVSQCEGLGCTTGGCQSGGCTSGCTITSCTAGGCESTCVVLCEGGTCQLECTSGEEGCSQSCEIYETSCSTTCEGSCTTASCQSTACQTGGCEATGCMQGCEATACTANCQASETSSCSYLCQVSSCRAACTTDMEQSGGCLTCCTAFCELGCRAQCEVHCTSACQYDGSETEWVCTTICQGTGCMQNCETLQQPNICNITCISQCMTADTETGCYGYCTVGSECSCLQTCEVYCRTGSETVCDCTCQTSAQPAPCSAGTESGCYSNCQVYLETGCSVGCELGCQAHNMTGGYDDEGCALYCTTGCRCHCQESCECACRTGTCETSCTCACQSSAEYDGPSGCLAGGCEGYCMSSGQAGGPCITACMHGCTTQCTSYCETACTTATCQAGCQGFGMTGGCATGCEVYCTVGCQCACMQTCESNCRSGCEASCMCLCQTAAQ